MLKKLLFIFLVVLGIYIYKNIPPLENKIEFEYAYIISNPEEYYKQLNFKKQLLYNQGLTLEKEIIFKSGVDKVKKRYKEYYMGSKSRFDDLNSEDKTSVYKDTKLRITKIYSKKKKSVIHVSYNGDNLTNFNVNNKYIVVGNIDYEGIPCKIIEVYDSQNILVAIMYVNEGIGMEFYIETFKNNPVIYKIKKFKVKELKNSIFQIK